MNTCTRRFGFDAGHRVTRHESKCRHVHGHRYEVEVTVHTPQLDPVGRVIDFGLVKDLVGAWIDHNLDHGYLAAPGDPVADYLVSNDLRVFVMPDDLGEPTAENIAALLARAAQSQIDQHPYGSGLRVTHVRVYETPNCWADWIPSPT